MNIIKFIKENVMSEIKHFRNKEAINLYWDNDKNFGDAINKYLVEKLTGKEVIKASPRYSSRKNYFVIGSILHKVNAKSIVWGSGFVSRDSKCLSVPHKIHAVRGPLTRELLLHQGISCPDVYGDPALLLPRIYSPQKRDKYKLGIIAHYVDKENKWLKNINDENINIIDIENMNYLEFIDHITSCEMIVSSSLHGLIVADAYSVPSLWVKFSDKVTGGGFKFLDYFSSVKRNDKNPVIINEYTTIDTLYNSFLNYKIQIDLDRLLTESPFEIKL